MEMVMKRSYLPEELRIFQGAFVYLIGRLPPERLTVENRLKIATRILDCAADGERDQEKLIEAGSAAVQA
jgi:hypothetical protein